MRFINTRAHGYMDYLMAVLLISSPWLFDFNRGGAETWVPVALGIMTILYSLMTDYELGAVPSLSMRTHLAIDVVSGIFLAASPWIFDFSEYVKTPHLVLGLVEVATALMTKTVPQHERAAHRSSIRQATKTQ